MNNVHWRPTASLEVLKARAQLYHKIRTFFAERQVLEVETPLLSAGSVPEPMIAPLWTDYHGATTQRLFLQTSPELAMKRLLAAGSGAIYQIAKVFRDSEVGRWHNPEFTLLEWYRPGFSQDDLIAEISDLLQSVLQCPPIEKMTYCDCVQHYTGLHPLHSSLVELQTYISQFDVNHSNSFDRETCLQWILCEQIESHLGQYSPVAITHFPANQAALARRCVDNPALAERFEIYRCGVELANGFHELTDVIEQRQRFERELEKRRQLGIPIYPLDERFLAALEAGLPDCSGVALGLDRLLMLITQSAHIYDVLTFPTEFA